MILEIFADLVMACGYFQMTEWGSHISHMGWMANMPIRLVITVLLTVITAKTTKVILTIKK